MLRHLIFSADSVPVRIARFVLELLTGPSRRPEPRPGSADRPVPRPVPVAPDPRTVQISPEEVFELRKQGAKLVFIDVREPMEIADGMIDGARHIPSGRLASRLAELSREDEIVVYCASGMRSTRAALFLRDKGFEKAKSLVGGFSGWVRNGGRAFIPPRT